MTEVILACVPILRGFRPIEGSREERCVDCGKSIWASPASKTVAGETAVFCCLSCVGRRIEKDHDPQFMQLSEGQLEELRKELF